MDDVRLYIQLATKSYMGADFQGACDILLPLKSRVKGRLWLDVQQISIACYREQMRTVEIEKAYLEISEELKTLDFNCWAKAYYLLSFCSNQMGDRQRVFKFSQLALEHALKNESIEDLQYALFSCILVDGAVGDQTRYKNDMEKLELLLRSYPKLEISISLMLLKIVIAMRAKQWDLARSQCWIAYEAIKKAGFFVYIPTVLRNLAHISIEMKSFDEAEAFLCLAETGVSEVNHPYLFQLLKRERDRFEENCPRVYHEHDLEVEIGRKVIREKTLGNIDFRNQHILLEIAFLLIRSPNVTFTKEALVEKVWRQRYRPTVHNNLVYVTVRRLREVLEPDPQAPRYIMRSRHGYYFNPHAKILIRDTGML